MYIHTEEYLSEAEMSPAQQVNWWADKLAIGALMAAVEVNEFISSIFPSEKVCVEIARERVTGSPKNAITELWGEQMAQALYDRQGVVSREPIRLLGRHGACTEIVPGDVLGLGNKTHLTFSRDQSTAVMHGQIGPECVSKLQVS